MAAGYFPTREPYFLFKKTLSHFKNMEMVTINVVKRAVSIVSGLEHHEVKRRTLGHAVFDIGFSGLFNPLKYKYARSRVLG